MSARVLHGTIVYADADGFHVFENSYIAEEDGITDGIYPAVPEKYKGVAVEDYGEDLIIPAFSDLHVHASQYVQRGVGMDCLLEDWLNRYTFPQESGFRDMEYARNVYDAFTDDLLRHGTMHAVVHATIHEPATSYLFERLQKKGLRAYVGKINMDKNSPDYLCEDTDESIRQTEIYLDKHQGGGRVQPILTPRFAPTCSEKLLYGLGKLAKKYHVGVQTHLVESRWEAAEAVREFPGYSCDAQIYERTGLMDNGPSVFAHVIFPTKEDLRIIREHGSFCVHCPDATADIIAGIMPLKKMQDDGVSIAIGSDIGGGPDIAIYHEISRAVQFSKLKEFYEPEIGKTITFANAFYLATKKGGSLFGENVGSLEPGFEFDALVIGGLDDAASSRTPLEKLERFCYIGDDRNIRARYLTGEKLSSM